MIVTEPYAQGQTKRTCTGGRLLLIRAQVQGISFRHKIQVIPPQPTALTLLKPCLTYRDSAVQQSSLPPDGTAGLVIVWEAQFVLARVSASGFPIDSRGRLKTYD